MGPTEAMGPAEYEPPLDGRPTIVHVTECDGGGVVRAVEQVVAAVDDHQHVVLAPPGSVRVPPCVQVVALPGTIVGRLKAVRETVERIRPVAVHAHSTWAGVYTRIQSLGVPVLYQPHCFAFSDVTRAPAVRGLFWAAERLLAGRTHQILTLTPAETLQARRVGAARVQEVPNSPTIAGRAPRTTDGRAPTVVMAGRIAAQKDPATFAEICRRVRQQDPSIGFMWIGDGAPEGRALLSDSGVRVTGWVDDHELERLLRQSDLYLHTAAYEGFPLSMLDAAALDVPVVGRDIPALAHVDLPRFRTPAEGTDVVLEALRPGRVREAAVDGAALLRRTMTRDAQREALVAAYRRCEAAMSEARP